MTLSDQETAAISFVERVQKVGTGPALSEVEDAVRTQTFEEIARRFDALGDALRATQVRRWRWQR